MQISLYPVYETQLIQPYFFSKNDLVSNFHLWQEEIIPFLFITGLAGSGKTTLGQQLALQYQCPLISLDKIKCFEHPQHGLIDATQVNKYFFYNKLFEFIQCELKEYQSRCIIEGIQCLFFDEKVLFQYPLLLRRTSLFRSSWNATQRIFRTKSYKYIPQVWKDNFFLLSHQRKLISLYTHTKGSRINLITYSGNIF